MLDRFAGFYLEEIRNEQKNIIKEVEKIFKEYDWIQGIILEGTLGNDCLEKDIFTDIDLCIIIPKNKEKFIANNIKKFVARIPNSCFFHRAPCGKLTYSIWILPFMRLDISFRTIEEVDSCDVPGKSIKIVLDKKNSIRKLFKKKKKMLTSRLSLEVIKELDSVFWFTIFFIFTKIERNNFCAVYDSFHFIVSKIILKLRRLDYNAPKKLYMHNLMKKDPSLYKELEIILDFPNEPIDSLLRSIILYKSFQKRILRQEGLSFESEAEPIVLRTIQRGLISRPKRWFE